MDTFHAVIKNRFDQARFNIFPDVEQLLLKSINGEDYQQELNNFLKIIRDDIDSSALPPELSIISTIWKEKNPAHFHDILSILKAISTNGRLLVKNIITIVKTVLDNGATTATPERLLRKQRRFKALAILNSNKNLVVILCFY